MNLEDKINNDIKSAMLAREKDKLEALRGIKAALLLLKTEKSANTLISDADEIRLLQKLFKQRKESGDIYKASGRDDLSKIEYFQADVVLNYLPKQLPVEEVEFIIKEIINETGALSIIDMGKVMGIAAKKLAGKADNKSVSDIVRKLLS